MEALETPSLTLRQLAPAHVGVFELFEQERDDAEAVFEYVPQESYGSVREAHDQLIDAREAWNDSGPCSRGLHL